jgi:hypothetical protein
VSAADSPIFGPASQSGLSRWTDAATDAFVMHGMAGAFTCEVVGLAVIDPPDDEAEHGISGDPDLLHLAGVAARGAARRRCTSCRGCSPTD